MPIFLWLCSDDQLHFSACALSASSLSVEETGRSAYPFRCHLIDVFLPRLQEVLQRRFED